MKCNTCQNYHISGDGTNEGYYTSCVERFHTLQIVQPMTKEYKQEVMDGKRKYCKGYEGL